MRIVIDFKGDLENYRSEIDPEQTVEALNRYFRRVSDLNDEYRWEELLEETFVVDVDRLSADLVKVRVIEALEEYTRASRELNLDIDRNRDLDPHTCVQWVFTEDGWVIVYNYNLWAGEFPKEILQDMGIELSRDLQVRYRAIVSFTAQDSGLLIPAKPEPKAKKVTNRKKARARATQARKTTKARTTRRKRKKATR